MIIKDLLNISLRRVLCLALVVLLSWSCFASDYVVKMKRKSGVYTIPCWVNGLKGDFIFDTGAANTSLSQEFVNELLRRKLLSHSDFTGATQTRNASGVVDNNTTIHIGELKLGNRIIYNVRAIVATSQKAPLLLGLNVIDLLGEWSMSKGRLVLYGPDDPTEYQDRELASDYPPMVDSEVTPLPELPPIDAVDADGATPSMRIRAYKGDAIAQYLMGMSFLTGAGVDADPKIAVFWLELSAAQNYRPAQLQLADCFEQGIGTERNQRAADYWRNRAETEGLE